MPHVKKLRRGDLALDVLPQVGGAIAGFRLGEVALLRPMGEAAMAEGEVRQASCFPLAPYSNRIEHGRFAFCGEDFKLALNFGDHPHSVHGNAWQSAWEVEAQGEDTLTLRLDHDPRRDGARAWPYAYRATQTFALEDDALVLTLEIKNRDARPQPAGLGFHPYFPRRPGATLRFEAADVWLVDDESMPVRRAPIAGQYDFSFAREVEEVRIDNGFPGFSGRAEIAFPGAGLSVTMEADPVFGHAVVYVPEGKDYFCVEPVSHMTDAINRMVDVPDHGLRILAPHETLRGSVRLRVGLIP